jgi:hypothetical protein
MERVDDQTVQQQHDVPEATRALSTIADPDYVDLFTITTSDAAEWSPEQWARAAFEDVAGLKGQIIFRVLLGLRLKWRPSPAYVAGWRIADRGENWLRLGADSRMLTAHLVIQVDDGQMSLATFMRYDRPIAARLWPTLSARHRRAAPGLLRDAHRVLQPKSPPPDSRAAVPAEA